MTMNWNRIFSSLLAVSYLISAHDHGGAESAFIAALFVMLPLACIWFADAMGGHVGLAANIAITKESPGIFVCVLGWVLLLLPLVIWMIGLLTR